MYWIKFKLLNLILALFILSSCSENRKETGFGNKLKDDTETSNLTNEEAIIRQVENRLSISASEKYDIQIEYKYINPDTLMDALILVNRKDYAYTKAKNTNTERFFESTGHTGLYNYVFVQLGGKDKLITTNPVGSNADYPLDFEFMELTSKAHQDFALSYRVRNSMYKSFYTVRNDRLFLTFSCPVFDSIGAEKPRVYDIQFPESETRIAKDIALYHGEIVGYKPEEIENINEYTPEEITNDGELYVYFIFDDKKMKYVTPMREK